MNVIQRAEGFTCGGVGDVELVSAMLCWRVLETGCRAAAGERMEAMPVLGRMEAMPVFGRLGAMLVFGRVGATGTGGRGAV